MFLRQGCLVGRRRRHTQHLHSSRALSSHRMLPPKLPLRTTVITVTVLVSACLPVLYYVPVFVVVL